MLSCSFQKKYLVFCQTNDFFFLLTLLNAFILNGVLRMAFQKILPDMDHAGHHILADKFS